MVLLIIAKFCIACSADRGQNISQENKHADTGRGTGEKINTVLLPESIPNHQPSTPLQTGVHCWRRGISNETQILSFLTCVLSLKVPWHFSMKKNISYTTTPRGELHSAKLCSPASSLDSLFSFAWTIEQHLLLNCYSVIQFVIISDLG